MQAALGICLLLALVSRGSTLQCEVCTGLGHNCTGEMEACPAGHDFCGITLFESEQGDVKVQGIVKNCVPSNVCENASADINLGKRRRSRTRVFCCKGDSCNNSPSKLPLLDTKLNGFRCPACYASTSTLCDNETVDCVGLESHCIDLAGYIHMDGTSKEVAMKGCATHAVCDASVGGAATFTGISSAITKLQCTKATSSACVLTEPTGLFLLATVGFLVNKF